jgi:hypothetical protein
MARTERGAVEAEGGREELAAEAVVLELRGERVDAGDLVFELRVVDDNPLEAERVGLAVDRGAGVPRDAAEQLLRVALAGRELSRRERLEDERGVTGRLERALGVERDGRGREREQLLGGRPLQLLAAEDDVAEAGQDSVVSSAGCAAGSGSGAGAGCSPPGAISFWGSPEPTSVLSFASSSSTCEAEEICASSRSSCV